MSYFSNYMNISETIGFVFTNIEYNTDEEELIFTRDNGKKYSMHHVQDCCEHVYLADVVGDWDSLINTPILMAEKSSQDGDSTDESSTWTFYKFGTIKGYVDLRWYGSSNGYYSEGVSFGEVE